MSKYNLGIAKTSILGKLNNQTSIKGFIGMLKESNLLKTELEIFNNIETRYIPNEDMAIKYIDENINLLKAKGYTKENFLEENNKFTSLVESVGVSSSLKEELYKNINTLLYESLQGKKTTNVNKLHDSFMYVVEHIKNNKKPIIESPVIPADLITHEYVIKKAIQGFNEKYSKALSESEMKVLNSIINETTEKRKEIFDTIRESALSELKTVKNEIGSTKNLDVKEQREVEQYVSKINESINKVTTLQFKEETYEEDVIGLVDLLSN